MLLIRQKCCGKVTPFVWGQNVILTYNNLPKKQKNYFIYDSLQVAGGLASRSGSTSSTAQALASSVSGCMRATHWFTTQGIFSTHHPKVLRVEGLASGVTAKRKLLGLSSETGETV